MTLAIVSVGQPLYLEVAGIPLEFLMFAATLIGIVALRERTLAVALTGLAAITLYKVMVTGFSHGPGLAGLAAHVSQEWIVLVNLAMLLLGFALLSRHFEVSNIPEAMPAVLPDDWKGGFVLLVIICLLSSILDNIAAALIGGTMAKHVFKGNVHIGYLAAIVAAANAGGAGSVVGDTTTTMMWIDGISPLVVVEAYVASAVALVIFGIPAAMLQQRYSPIQHDPPPGLRVDWARLAIVLFILFAAIACNVLANLYYSSLVHKVPVIGLAVWAAILLTAIVRRPDWSILPSVIPGTIFLLALVACASMMTVEKLPDPTWQSALGLGFVSAVFDNIPLTALALRQGGYDWGFLAFAVGFGGSMIWFGSSAGVAIANMFPQARSARDWVRHGWYVPVAYVAGFFVMLAVLGWNADPPHRRHAHANGVGASTPQQGLSH